MNERDTEIASVVYGSQWTMQDMEFADLIRADEREACAKLLESRKSGANELMDSVRDLEARAIRAMGNT